MLYYFLAAFALMLVLEGIFPFLSPDKWRYYVQLMASKDNRTLRVTGLLCMLAGVILLTVVHGYID